MLFNNDLSFLDWHFSTAFRCFWVDLFCQILFDVQVPQILVLRRACALRSALLLQKYYENT